MGSMEPIEPILTEPLHHILTCLISWEFLKNSHEMSLLLQYIIFFLTSLYENSRKIHVKCYFSFFLCIIFLLTSLRENFRKIYVKCCLSYILYVVFLLASLCENISDKFMWNVTAPSICVILGICRPAAGR